jgi:hypothetical protein
MVLYALALLMTVGVYGLVAMLVKLDDAGEALARKGGGAAVVGGWLLRGTPGLMRGISWVGAVAMLLVGGQLVLHAIHPLDGALKAAAEGLGGLAGGALGVAGTLAVGAVAGGLVLAAVTAVKKLRALTAARTAAARERAAMASAGVQGEGPRPSMCAKKASCRRARASPPPSGTGTGRRSPRPQSTRWACPARRSSER